MKTGFPAVLSRLRREKGVNQRAAARELNISQALLSHYENGLREPGLEFLSKACDYYGVSADFLLGRSDEKNAAKLPGGEDSVEAACCRSVFELFTRLDEHGDDRLKNSAADIVSVELYRLSRLLGENTDCVISEEDAMALCAAAVALDGIEVRLRIQKTKPVCMDCFQITEAAEARLLKMKNPSEEGE